MSLKHKHGALLICWILALCGCGADSEDGSSLVLDDESMTGNSDSNMANASEDISPSDSNSSDGSSSCSDDMDSVCDSSQSFAQGTDYLDLCDSHTGELSVTEMRFLALINNYRAENGLDELTPLRSLNRAARAHAQHMAQEGYFDHRSTEGLSHSDRICIACYQEACSRTTLSGENIYAGSALARDAFSSWQMSPGHNENMLTAGYRAIGIGLFSDNTSEYGHYWATSFGSHLNAE